MIEAKEISKSYGNKWTLNGVSLKFLPGRVYGLVGPNGAGKSTLIRILTGIEEPECGSVLVDGTSIGAETYQNLALVSEAGTLFADMSGAEHAKYFAKLYPSFDMEAFEKYVKYFEVPVKQKAGKLSKGEYVKLETILGLCKRTKYLIIDEPFLGSDMYTRRDLLKLIAANMQEDSIVIVATHLLTELEQFMDEVVCMKQGSVYASYNLEELRSEGTSLVEKIKEVFHYSDQDILEIL